MNNKINEIVVVGADVTGLAVALYINKHFNETNLKVKLVDCPCSESNLISTTHPSTHVLFQALNIDMRELMQATDATFVLGTEYKGWSRNGLNAFVPYTPPPQITGFFDFHQFWLRAKTNGDAEVYEAYSMPAMAAREGKFMFPSKSSSTPLAQMSFGINFDNIKLAKYLRNLALGSGIEIIKGELKQTLFDGKKITALQLDQQRLLKADFFIDCCGVLRSQDQQVSTETTVNRRYRAVFNHQENNVKPMNTLQALPQGWLKQCQLRNRSEYTFTFNSNYLDDETVREGLLAQVGAEPINESFTAINVAENTEAWQHNCLNLNRHGLQGVTYDDDCFALLFNDIMYFVELFPSHIDGMNSLEYNRLIHESHELVLAFQLFPLVSSNGFDNGFWQHLKQLTIPEILSRATELFKTHGRLPDDLHNDLIAKHQWAALFIGMGLKAKSFHPLIDEVGQEEVLSQIREKMNGLLAAMPDHNSFW